MRRISFVRIFFYFIFILLCMVYIVWSAQVLFAQTSVDERERQLKEQLEKIEQEQQEVEKDLNVQKQKSATIERDVNVLSGQIKQAQLNISKKNLTINELGQDIDIKDQTVAQLDAKMSRSKEALAQLIRRTNELEDVSLAEILLTQDDISDFFINLDTYNRLGDSLDILFDEIREIRGLTEEEKKALEEKQNRERDVKAEIEAEKRRVAQKESEKKELLGASKQTEKTYSTILEAKRQQAAAIRSALFQLRDSAGISFGDALKYAEEASKATGVRTAFILAILKQETNLGKNVGTCNRTGDPESKLWYNIMPGPTDGSWRDDQTIYKRIVKQLGRPEIGTPLSCPIGNGWGGAMGPSQFIPATWQGYEPRLKAALGTSPDPWNPKHAFTATAMYVQDLGASNGGYTAEHTAALKYYAGSNWSLPQNAFYGNSVMKHAADLQTQIDFLNDIE